MQKKPFPFLSQHPYWRGLLFALSALVVMVVTVVLGNRSFNQYDSYIDFKTRVKNFVREGIYVSLIDPLEEKKKLLTLFRQEIRGYDRLSDFEKLNEIRKWASIHFDTSAGRSYGAVKIDHNTVSYRAKPTTEKIYEFLRNESDGGFFCGGKSEILAEVYRLLGFQVYILSYGFREGELDLTHAVVLVEVNGKTYIQDPHTNGAYYRKDKSPMPLGEILAHLANRSHRQIDYVNDEPKNYRYEYHTSKPNNPTCFQKAANHYICTTKTPLWLSLVPFFKDFEKQLVTIGFPGHSPYALLHPFGMNTKTLTKDFTPGVSTLRRLQQWVLQDQWKPDIAAEWVKKRHSVKPL